MKYLINSVAFGTSKQDVFDAKSIISALMRNGGILNTRVFGIDMSSCMDGTEESPIEDTKDIHGMKNFRARNYTYDAMSGNFLEMVVQQIAGRGEKITISRSVLAGLSPLKNSRTTSTSSNVITTNGKKKRRENVNVITVANTSSSSSTTISTTTTAGACDISNDDISDTQENANSSTILTVRLGKSTTGVIQTKKYSYGDSTSATLWESSEKVDTTNSRRRNNIKLSISTDDKNSKHRRVRHSRAVKKHNLWGLKSFTAAKKVIKIKSKLCKNFPCKKPNCGRLYFSQYKLDCHMLSGNCYNGTATQCVTIKKRRYSRDDWVAKPALMPILDFCIKLAQNDQLTTARLDTRVSVIAVVPSESSTRVPAFLKVVRSKIFINDNTLLKVKTVHTVSAQSLSVPSPNRLGALKAKTPKSPRTASQLLCVLQAYQKGVDNSKEKLTSTQFANQMSIMGTFRGEQEFPNNVWMKHNPHGFSTFAKIELLNRHQVKAYFGSGLSKLQNTYQSLLDQEFSLFELSFITFVRDEVKRRKQEKLDKMILTIESVQESFASYCLEKQSEPYVVTTGKYKNMLSTIKTKEAGEDKLLRLQMLLRIKEAREGIINHLLNESPLRYDFIRQSLV